MAFKLGLQQQVQGISAYQSTATEPFPAAFAYQLCPSGKHLATTFVDAAAYTFPYRPLASP